MSKIRIGSIAAVCALLVSGSAYATGPVDTLFAGVDLSTVTTSVTTIGVAVVGIVLAYKAIDLVKRAISKV
jgi:hypothetical protein